MMSPFLFMFGRKIHLPVEFSVGEEVSNVEGKKRNKDEGESDLSHDKHMRKMVEEGPGEHQSSTRETEAHYQCQALQGQKDIQGRDTGVFLKNSKKR